MEIRVIRDFSGRYIQNNLSMLLTYQHNILNSLKTGNGT